jgi:hypothetical protein
MYIRLPEHESLIPDGVVTSSSKVCGRVDTRTWDSGHAQVVMRITTRLDMMQQYINLELLDVFSI